MEMKQGQLATLPFWVFATALLFKNLVIPVGSAATFEDQKNCFSKDPKAGSSPTSFSFYLTPTPSNMQNSPPSHGSGEHGNPGEQRHHTTPSPPREGVGGLLSLPSDPYPKYTKHSFDPVIASPPITPSTPDPNSPPFSCTSVNQAFGVPKGPGFGANMNLLQALSNTRREGTAELYREGTAALLNTMVPRKFPYTTKQVKESFVAALGSKDAAAVQAQLFKLANEERIRP